MKRLSKGDQFRLVTNVNKNTSSSNYAVKKVAICFVWSVGNENNIWVPHEESNTKPLNGLRGPMLSLNFKKRSRSWASPYIIFMWSACISESLVFPRSIHSWRNNLNGPIVVHLPKAYLVTKLLFLVKSWDFQFEITKETATSLKLSLCFRKLLVLKPFHSTFHCDEWVSRASEKRHSVTGSKSFI